jgi:hypothetical protein
MRLALRLASVACQLATVVCPLHPTYRHVFNLCLLQLEVLFREHRFARRVLKRVRVERVLWAWAGDVPVVLSWTGADKSVGSGHSDMPGCGCNKCAHGRPKPRPARPVGGAPIDEAAS